ncbi:MAG: SGNH/GDSL hydrolase family protein [Actinophytocola sp.]|uniref:SGNH/GDSL hydrolase family protein n=1 Tax=Actinophytocola sp. TaxID=1872138 RepID=UPI001324D742|nr:SGNH/GDSL hydrolase family protein [Actinophytocola sp.]MPZ81416.1 SGNH/GDSL hydrolase family protein [Actinophytocola sp.]
MTIPKKWRSRSLIATGLLGAVVSTVLVASTGQAVGQGSGGHRTSPEWVGTWAASVTRGNASGSSFVGLDNQSARMIVHTSVGGAKIRIRLTNLHGEQAIEVGRATVAKPNTATAALSDIDAASTRELRFNGSPTATINRGAELLSDPVGMRLADDQDLVVSVFFPTPTGLTTFHQTTRQTNFVGAGDLAAAAGGGGYTTEQICCWFFLSGVDVLRQDSGGTVGVFADSLADGHGTTLNGNLRWPDQLTDRLLEVRSGDIPGVLNFGLGGSRLNHEGNEPGDGGFPGNFALGTNALARMNEDVFSETGLHTVVVDLGINDIWMNNEPADEIIASLRQINQQARQRGIQVVMGTLGPFNGLTVVGSVWSEEKDATRNAVNTYIREHRYEFDAVVDFDKLLRDPADPTKLKAEFDSGDHIHPNDVGSKAMADTIPLNLIVR